MSDIADEFDAAEPIHNRNAVSQRGMGGHIFVSIARMDFAFTHIAVSHGIVIRERQITPSLRALEAHRPAAILNCSVNNVMSLDRVNDLHTRQTQPRNWTIENVLNTFLVTVTNESSGQAIVKVFLDSATAMIVQSRATDSGIVSTIVLGRLMSRNVFIEVRLQWQNDWDHEVAGFDFQWVQSQIAP